MRMDMKRRGFLAGLAALPLAGLATKVPAKEAEDPQDLVAPPHPVGEDLELCLVVGERWLIGHPNDARELAAWMRDRFPCQQLRTPLWLGFDQDGLQQITTFGPVAVGAYWVPVTAAQSDIRLGCMKMVSRRRDLHDERWRSHFDHACKQSAVLPLRDRKDYDQRFFEWVP